MKYYFSALNGTLEDKPFICSFHVLLTFNLAPSLFGLDDWFVFIIIVYITNSDINQLKVEVRI